MPRAKEIFTRATGSKTCHEIPQEQQSYSSTISLTSALEGGGWLTPCRSCFTQGGRRGTVCIGVEPRASLEGCVKSPYHRDLIPGRSIQQEVAIPTELSRMKAFTSPTVNTLRKWVKNERIFYNNTILLYYIYFLICTGSLFYLTTTGCHSPSALT